MWRWKTEHGVVYTLHLCYKTEDWPGQNIVVDQRQRQLFVLVQAVEVHLIPEQQAVLRQTGLSQQKGAVRAQVKLSPWDVEHRDRHPLTIKTLQDDNIKRKGKGKWCVANYLCSAFNPSKCTHTVVNIHLEQWWTKQ